MSLVRTARSKALDEILSYTYPRLHTGSCWYISFYAFDPARGEMRRKRIKINSVGTAAQKRRYATQVCNRLSTQLESGWNPWVKAEADNCYKLFEDAISHYRRHITKLLNDGVHRQTTHHCYMSFAGMLEKWNNRKTPIRYVYQFDRTFCVRFLDYVYLERKSSPSTRNNALAFLRSFSTFLVQHLYLKERPTAGLQNLRKAVIQKQRTGIAPEDMKRLHDWLLANNRPFLLVCYFLHYLLIRPREIAKLRLADISVAKQTVYIDASISKNKKSASVTIPVQILELMIDLGYFSAPSSFYIFSEGFRPGAEYCSERNYRDYWKNIVAPALHFPIEYKFYSLKDSGITAMLRAGLDALSVKEQARHSSLQITDAYTPREVKKANPALRNYRGDL